MNWEAAHELIKQEIPVSRTSWDDCKIIRKAIESDIEYINYPVEGVVVSDCNRRLCDCKIAIHTFTEEEMKAIDWVKVIKQPKA